MTLNPEEIMTEAKEELTKAIKAFPEEISRALKDHQETFIMGYLLGRTDMKFCKENFPEFDWDSPIAKLISTIGTSIVDYMEEVKTK